MSTVEEARQEIDIYGTRGLPTENDLWIGVRQNPYALIARLLDERAAQADRAEGVVEAARQVVAQYQWNSKSGRPDYMAAPINEATMFALVTAVLALGPVEPVNGFAVGFAQPQGGQEDHHE